MLTVGVDAMVDALTSIHPPAQLKVGLGAKYVHVLIGMFPVWFQTWIIHMIRTGQQETTTI